jgi:rubrerythrin
MPHEISQLAESIRMAIDMEKSGRAFYLQAADKTTHPTGKAIFARLAKEETLHLLTFERMLDDSAGLDSWRDWLKDFPHHPVLPVFGEKAKKSIKEGPMDELQALRVAMQQEREAIDYYGRVAANADNEAVSGIFTFVREQETYHYDLLQAEYDSITQSGFWFDSPEFRMDGKF